ncbi:MAG: hypothetical protein NVS3B15_12000 [Sediminibacterium sp.]
MTFYANSQKVYVTGDKVNDFPVGTVLNDKTQAVRFYQLRGELTVLDFFGTWCAPCIKAIPHLQELQRHFPGKLNIVLVSTETPQILAGFISKRPGFPFPMIVDADQAITALFQPPSYPYTIVMNKEGMIIAVSNAAALTENAVKEWLEQPETVATQSKKTSGPVTVPVFTAPVKGTENRLVQLSQDFIYAAKTGGATTDLITQLASTDFATLPEQLKDDAEKKAFWINIYNGFTQYLLKKNKGAYQNRHHFFGARQINIGNHLFSLDDIEHGILRRSKIKWSEGYLNKPFPSKTERALRVSAVDYRIHFSLNCGAESCPPIAFYEPGSIDRQLDIATKAYLAGEARYDSTSNTLLLPKLMSWFRGDFGGKRKMKSLARNLGILPEGKDPVIRFKPYSWNLYLDHYN